MKNRDIKVSDYIEVKKKAQSLGCNIPDSITILPRNFEYAKSKDEFIHESTTATVRVLWRKNAIIESQLEKPGEKFPSMAEQAFEWIAPTIFIPALLITQNPYLITIALNVISNYLTDFFKGIPKDQRKVNLRIVIEKNEKGVCKKVEYKGPPDGLKDLPEVIKEVYDEQN